MGNLGVDSYNKLGFYTDAELEQVFGEYVLFQRVENGFQNYAEVRDVTTGELIFIVTPREDGGSNYYNSYGEYIDAVIQGNEALDWQIQNIDIGDNTVTYYTDTDFDGISLKTSIEYSGQEPFTSYELLGDSNKLLILQEIISGVDSATGEYLTFGERIAKGFSEFGEYIYGFIPGVSRDIASGATAETFEKLGITRDSIITSVQNFQDSGAETINTINTWLIEKKAEGGAWEYLDCIASLSPRLGIGSAMEVSINNGSERSYDVFVGVKPGLISNGLLTDRVQVGTELGITYGNINASSFIFADSNVFTDEDWGISSDSSLGISKVALNDDGSVTFDFKFHRGFFGVEGSIDLTRTAELIYGDIINFYNKLIEKIW